jgi:hypothetical protein
VLGFDWDQLSVIWLCVVWFKHFLCSKRLFTGCWTNCQSLSDCSHALQSGCEPAADPLTASHVKIHFTRVLSPPSHKAWELSHTVFLNASTTLTSYSTCFGRGQNGFWYVQHDVYFWSRLRLIWAQRLREMHPPQQKSRRFPPFAQLAVILSHTPIPTCHRHDDLVVTFESDRCWSRWDITGTAGDRLSARQRCPSYTDREGAIFTGAIPVPSCHRHHEC